ncbi:hypothetical protein CBM2609_B40044 [Cupriavidus taiwanensis]|nr:hypothetical protein CBM2604_B50043 [Cupriavidus taiwanensis]SOZ32861.1 hypothetical protein CBM2609_B40044 [Cupriavidus taiwanensis]SOZ48283.1 hypothetical protein CBM2610_B40043 [Cupriavidus taiwanensis]
MPALLLVPSSPRPSYVSASGKGCSILRALRLRCLSAMASLPLPPDNADWLASLKSRIGRVQHRAAVAVNQALVKLYWDIGKEILERQAKQGWGAKVIERLAQDLRQAFPRMSGLSRSNLMAMRAFAEAWPDAAIVQQLVGQLPRGHNQVLLQRLKLVEHRRWYAQQALTHGWSRAVLLAQIDAALLAGQRRRRIISLLNCRRRSRIWRVPPSRIPTSSIFLAGVPMRPSGTWRQRW